VAGLVWFIFGLILLLISVIGMITFGFGLRKYLRRRADGRNPDAPAVSALVAVVCLVLGGLIIMFDSMTFVGARNDGIVVEFGRVKGSLPAGQHWVDPWASVEKVDATVQNINLNADLGQWANKNCTTVAVRMQNGMTACLDLTLQWNIEETHASDLWQRYRGNNDKVVANIGTNVVERELRRALNDVFANYDPFSAMAAQEAATGNVVASNTTPNPSTISTDVLASQALAQLKQNVDAGITVDKLLISLVHYDATTQSKLDGLAQAIADTRIATQNKLTAEQQKEANDLLASASSNDDGVKFQNCINLLLNLAAKDQLKNLPVNAAQCVAGAGSSTPVIVGSGQQQ
jgi:regulator of protease activity HflC (stomatin/prohibitin superfamily)